MSRWSKSRPHSVTVPIESLIKEKENNSDRITALRSAGTIGRWGITSFTSIRNTNYGNLFVTICWVFIFNYGFRFRTNWLSESN